MYNPMELMICCAARLLEDGETLPVAGAPGVAEVGKSGEHGRPYR